MKAQAIPTGTVFYPKSERAPEVFAAIDWLLMMDTGLFGGYADALDRTPDGIAVDWIALKEAHVHDTTLLPFLLAFSSLDSTAAEILVDEDESFLRSISRAGNCDEQEVPVIAALGGQDVSRQDFERNSGDFTRNLVELIAALRIKSLFKIEIPIRNQYSIRPSPVEFKKRLPRLKQGSDSMAASIFAMYNSRLAVRELAGGEGFTWNPTTPSGIGKIWMHKNPETIRLWFRTVASYCGW